MPTGPKNAIPLTLDKLNFQHLLYFWMVARCGTISAAARQLHLTSPTLSSQIRRLEKVLGRELLQQEGRKLELTDAGRIAKQYADQIFGLGVEMTEALASQASGGTVRLRVGVVDVMPKLVAQRFLQPLMSGPIPFQLHCSEGQPQQLLENLVAHELDVVLADAPLVPTGNRKIFNRLLGRSPISFFAAPSMQLKRSDHTPLADLLRDNTILLPVQGSELRRLLNQYFDLQQIVPRQLHEFADTAMMKVFGESGAGIFPAPTFLRDAICAQYSVVCLGQADSIQESFYAVTTERQIPHPAVEILTRQSIGD